MFDKAKYEPSIATTFISLSFTLSRSVKRDQFSEVPLDTGLVSDYYFFILRIPCVHVNVCQLMMQITFVSSSLTNFIPKTSNLVQLYIFQHSSCVATSSKVISRQYCREYALHKMPCSSDLVPN